VQHLYDKVGDAKGLDLLIIGSRAMTILVLMIMSMAMIVATTHLRHGQDEQRSQHSSKAYARHSSMICSLQCVRQEVQHGIGHECGASERETGVFQDGFNLWCAKEAHKSNTHEAHDAHEQR